MKTDQQPKIALYATRSMGEKINATFDFVKENWRVWCRYLIYFLLPVCIIQGLGIDSLIDLATQSNYVSEDDVIWGLITVFLFMGVGVMLMTTVNLTIFKAYQDRTNRLEGITLRELWHALWRNGVRMLLVGVFYCVVFMPLYILLNIVLIFIPLAGNLVSFALSTPVILLPIIYLYERPIGFIAAIKRAFSLGFSQFFQLAFLGIVMGFLILIINSTPVIAITVVELIKNEFFGDVTVVNSFFKLFSQVVAVASCMAVYMGISFYLLAIVFHYGSVTARRDDASLEGDINNFENL